MNKYNVDIVISDGDGKIIQSQSFEEFIYGTKNIEIIKILM